VEVFQSILKPDEPLHFASSSRPIKLVLAFGSRTLFEDRRNFTAIRAAYPDAVIAGCSTAGEIQGTMVRDETLVTTAIAFDDTRVQFAAAEVGSASDSFAAGKSLADALQKDDLIHVLIFSDGLNVNGTELVRGLKSRLPQQVEVTGGLAGDGELFQKTLVCANDFPTDHTIAAIGLYGQHIKIGYGSVGGWDSFGPERLITRAKGNVLFDLDGKPALGLYKRYLADHAAGLPATALLFPLSLRSENGNGVVRTILGINEAEQSMTFAGDMPEGHYARLMKANFDRLIDGAIAAAEVSEHTSSPKNSAQFALLISCVGRKLVLKQRIEEEVEGVRHILGDQAALAGFYSYGEISPHAPGGSCELHNQTMTITTFSEY
jgi:hypothetical protein